MSTDVMAADEITIEWIQEIGFVQSEKDRSYFLLIESQGAWCVRFWMGHFIALATRGSTSIKIGQLKTRTQLIHLCCGLVPEWSPEA